MLVLLAWLVAYPLAVVLGESVRTPEGWTLDAVRHFVSTASEWKALWASVWISVASVFLAGLIGIPLAFLFVRFDFPGRRILSGLVALPAVLPPMVGVVAFLFLYGESGFAGRIARALLGRDEAPWRLTGAWAILLVHAYSMYVYFYLFTRIGLGSIDPALLEASASLGAGRMRTLRRVVFPLLAPSLAGASLLTFMTSLASFSAPYIFGGGFRVMTTQIVSTRLNGDYMTAMVETVALTLVALIGLWLIGRLGGDANLSGGGKGQAPAAVRIESRRVRIFVSISAWAFAAFLLLPHATLVLLSFVPQGTWTNEVFPPRYTGGNYIAMFRSPERLRPLVNSLWMASAATAAAIALSLTASWLVVRGKVRVRRWIEALLALPWAVPGTVFAIALATLFGVHAPWAGRVILIGTLWLLPLAYLVRNLPITSRAILSAFRSLDPSLDEAAASLGAGRWRIIRRVLLPMLRPAILAGGALAFATSLGDFVTSIVLYTYDTRPLSLEILSGMRQWDVGEAAAYGMLLMIISALVFIGGSGKQGASG